MWELIKVHFDELLLSIMILVFVGVWIYHPDAKEWVGSFIAALIMALRNRYSNNKEDQK
jgi:hypothetical protein